jgi:hypothetical protein
VRTSLGGDAGGGRNVRIVTMRCVYQMIANGSHGIRSATSMAEIKVDSHILHLSR